MLSKFTRRTLSLLIAVIMVISISSTCFATGNTIFSDLDENDDCYEAAIYLYNQSIMVGTDSTHFSANSAMTRGQLVTILWRMLHKPTPVGSVTNFSDCDSSSFYYDAVRWASSSGVGIVMGNPDGTFLPNGVAKVMEVYTFLYRFMCYVGKVSNSSASIAMYELEFDNSALSAKQTFSAWSHAAVGWAYTINIVTDYDIWGTSPMNRGDTAQCIYGIYQNYQSKYGLAVGNRSGEYYYGKEAYQMMDELFDSSGAASSDYGYITRAEFVTAMSNAFSNSTGLDVCYLFIHGHGNSQGIHLFTDANYQDYMITPHQLRSMIDSYEGTFVVFVAGCKSGVFINNSDVLSPDNVSTGEFDPQAFVESLLGENTRSANNLCSERIKVFCTAEADEESYGVTGYTVPAICTGCGYDPRTELPTSLHADANADGYVSLEEMFQYADSEMDRVISLHPTWHRSTYVRYPIEERYIIFQ